MTSNEATGPQSSANNYPLPEDQFAFESELRTNYERQHPGGTPLLSEALAQIQRKAGIDSPMFVAGSVEQIAGPESADDIIDKDGYILSGSTDFGASALRLRIPVDHTEEQIQKMTDRERTEASATHVGFNIIGEVPAETTDLLAGIYGLIGAETIRDDKANDQPEGVILRRGSYLGSPIYIVEEYSDADSYWGVPTLSAQILSEDLGKEMETGLNGAQMREFAEESGIDRFKLANFVAENGVTAANYKDMAGLMREMNEIADNAVADEGEALSKRVAAASHVGQAVTQELIVKPVDTVVAEQAQTARRTLRAHLSRRAKPRI